MTISPNFGFLASPAIFLILPVLVLIFAYAVLRAIRVRRALMLPFYKGQALWIGASGIYWILFYILAIMASTFQAFGPNWDSLQVQGIITILMCAALFIGFVAFFAWIDNLAAIARDSDPRNRDILRWRNLRLLVWSIIAVQIAWGALFVAPSILSNLTSPPIIELVAFYAGSSPGFFLTSGVGTIALLAGAYRSRDKILRKQLKWTGLYFLTLFVNVSLAVAFVAYGGVLNTNGVSNIFFPLFTLDDLALALFLFQVSRSLVPLNRLLAPV